MEYAISLFTENTRGNIRSLYENIMGKYSPTKQCFIKWNARLYSICNTTPDYSQVTNTLDIDLPYSEDIMNYIKAVDNYYEDTDVLNRFLVKIKNENSLNLMDFISDRIEQLHNKSFITDVTSFMCEEDIMYLNAILKDNPEVLEVCRKFSTDNLLMRN